MIFAGIDVHIITHPRSIDAGVDAMGLWLWGMCYSQLHLTDGVLPRKAVLGAFNGRRNIILATRLVSVGLWIAHESGDWVIHNWAEKNPTASDVRRRKELAAERQSRWRKRVSNASHNALVTIPPIPIPIHTHIPEEEERPATPPESQENASEETGVRPSTLKYRHAYCAGIAKAKGSPYAWPPGPKSDEWADKDLGHAIATFAKSRSTGQALRGETLLSWIQAAAEDFVAHVVKAKDDPKFWSHFAPKGLVKFLNQDRQESEARDVG